MVQNLDGLSDLELVRGCLKRTMTFCDQLVRRHARAVNKFLRLKCGSIDLADDLTQETFRKMYEKLSSFKGDASLKTWLFSIASNTHLDHVRGMSREGRQVSIDDCDQSPALQLVSTDRSSNPYVQASRRQQLERAMTAIHNELTPRQREVLLLQMQGFSYEEMAQVTGMEKGTVGKTLNDARKRLIEVLGPGTGE